MRGGDRYQPFGCETEVIDAGAMWHTAFDERHVLGNPGNTFCSAKRRQSQSESGCRGYMGLTECRDFMQRAAQKPATENCVDGRNAKGQGVGTPFDPRYSL
jgi:hypothetical protein